MNLVRRLRSLFVIAFATLRHEWLPTLCLVMALAAVLCPVVLILGLKHGTVENLRQNLLRDPSNLEIRPRMSMQVDHKLLQQIRSMEGVGFLVPKTRSLGSASVEFELNEKRVDVDLIPTAPGDPLLDIYKCMQPEFEEVILTHAAAVSLSADIGDEVVMFLSRRTDDGLSETVSLSLKIKGVLPQEATTIRAGYVQLPLLSSVEEYRENLAVPRLGWAGPQTQHANPIFDGFFVLDDVKIPPDTISRVSVATGFLSHRRIGPDDIDKELARACQGSEEAMLFFNNNDPRFATAIEAAADIIGADINSIYPWVKPLEVKVSLPGGEEKTHWLHTSIAPSPRVEGDGIPWIAVSYATDELPQATLSRNSPVGVCKMPCRLVLTEPSQNGSLAYANASLTGMLRHLDTRHLEWDPLSERFLLGRRCFSGIRLYADSLPSVSKVTAELAAIGIDSNSEAAKVARVMKFDKDLSILFWLVSAFSLAGGGAALALSLYGAIDRRKRDYAMLRMLGLPRSWLVLLPLIESITVAVTAFFIALAVYHLNAAVINRLFGHLENDRPGFCFLPPELQALVLLCSLGLAVCGALAAAARLLSISPSNAIRHA